MDPALGSHIAQICKATTACKICRMHAAMMSLDPLNTLNPSNQCPLAGIADCELHALFRRHEIAVPIKNKRAAVLPSPEGLQYGQPLAGLSRVEGTKPNSVCSSRNPYLLPRSEACGHRAFRRANPILTFPSLFLPALIHV